MCKFDDVKMIIFVSLDQLIFQQVVSICNIKGILPSPLNKSKDLNLLQFN